MGKLYTCRQMFHYTAATNAPASSCIECGTCVVYCTQQLNIPNLLKKVADLFE